MAFARYYYYVTIFLITDGITARLYGGSVNRGIPKPSIFMGFSLINHSAIGDPPF